MAGISFKVHTEGISALKGKMEKAGSKAERDLAIEVARTTEPFVPAKTKSLVNRTHVVGSKVIYPSPYARFLYGGLVYIDPETGSTWARYGTSKVPTNRALNISTAVNPKAQSYWFEASKRQNMEKWEKFAAKAVSDELK